MSTTNCILILRDNFANTDFLSNFSASSEQTAFPVDNAFNQQRRSKVWRSNGFFNIVSSSNTILFQEDGATDLTANVAVTEYTSASALATAIKTAMEAVGASTYTIAIDATTLKFVFTSDGAGGGGTLDLKWASSTAMAGILGFDTVDLTGSLTYTADVLKIHTSEAINLDFGIPTQPNMFALVGIRNRPFKFSQSATIKLQGNETDSLVPPTSDTTLTFDDNVLFFYNENGISTIQLRHWRILFTDTENATGFIEVGAFALGDEIIGITQGTVQFPLETIQVDRSVTLVSEGGQTLSDERAQTQDFILQWNFLTKTERELLEENFDFFGTSKPFFINIDESALFNTTQQKGLKLVKYVQAPRYRLTRPNLFQMTMNLREEI